MDDDALLERGRSGDQPALVELYQRYRPRVFGYIFRMTGDRDLADEVFAATFARLLGSLDQYKPRGQFAAYLFTIARNRLIEELKARNRSHPGTDVGSLDDLPAPKAPDPAELVSNAEAAERVEAAVARLPLHLREVVLLRVHDDQDYATIGRILGVGEATVRSRLRYALEWLRNALPEEPA